MSATVMPKAGGPEIGRHDNRSLQVAGETTGLADDGALNVRHDISPMLGNISKNWLTDGQS